MGTKREARHGRLSSMHLMAAVGAVMMLLAIGAVGCGGGNTGTFPLAGVWVANSGLANVHHYQGTDFLFNGSFAFPPVPVLTSPFRNPQDTLFDAAGNMWVVDGGDGVSKGEAVFKFTLTQLINLNTTPNPPPSFIVTTGPAAPVNFVFPQFAAFDTAGNLWVSDAGAVGAPPAPVNHIFKYTAMQLTAVGGATSPAAVLTNIAPPALQAFDAPLGIAFDAAGNLWVDNNGGTTIVEISKAQLDAAVGVTGVLPTTTLNTNAPPPGGLKTINNPWGILFDSKGNLWFTNEQLSVSPCSGSVVEFAAGTFTGPGPVMPPANVVITQTAVGGTTSLCDPNGITMNTKGDIVVANAGGNSLAQYTASQITAAGNPTPHTFVVGLATRLSAPTGLTYGPLSLK